MIDNFPRHIKCGSEINCVYSSACSLWRSSYTLHNVVILWNNSYVYTLWRQNFIIPWIVAVMYGDIFTLNTVFWVVGTIHNLRPSLVLTVFSWTNGSKNTSLLGTLQHLQVSDGRTLANFWRNFENPIEKSQILLILFTQWMAPTNPLTIWFRIWNTVQLWRRYHILCST